MDVDADPEGGLLLGLCDDPENQSRPVLTYNPRKQGHLAVCGGPSTGKSTLLQTILWQLCSRFTPEEMVFAIAAAGQEETAIFDCMPHCLGTLRERKGRMSFFTIYSSWRIREKRCLQAEAADAITGRTKKSCL